MLQLYSAGVGSDEVTLGQRVSDATGWADTRQHVVALLRARGFIRSADLLETTPFEVYKGTNVFKDDFFILYLEAPPDHYIEYERKHSDKHFRGMVHRIVDASRKITGWYIRFVMVDILRPSMIPAVASPKPTFTSAAVERALTDAEILIATSGPTSAVDRAHTAFHGFLLALAADAGISVETDASVTSIFKKLRGVHPGIQVVTEDKDMQRIFFAASSIIDTLNAVRNRRTLAHPNEGLLDSAAAMLMINGIRTILHYLDAVSRP
jgi:hypothetical protein